MCKCKCYIYISFTHCINKWKCKNNVNELFTLFLHIILKKLNVSKKMPQDANFNFIHTKGYKHAFPMSVVH
jgi:hypothetical protein